MKRITMIAPAVGRFSEVWMYRQMTRMPGVSMRVVAETHENPDLYPVAGFGMATCPPRQIRRARSSLGLSSVAKRIRRLRNFGLGGLDAHPPTAAFWRREIRDHRPDAVLIQYGTLAVHYAPMLRRRGIPYVIHGHGYDLSRMVRRPKYADALDDAVAGAAAVVVVAQYMRRYLVERGTPVEKIHLIPCGIPWTELAGHRPLPSQSDQGCDFLMVGRLTDKKAPVAAITAFADCHAIHRRTTLTVVGDGERIDECRRLVAARGVEGVVRFTGPLAFAEVREKLRRSSVFIQHSVTTTDGDREGWPVSIAEAAAVGLPVVSTRHAGIPEQIVEGRGGHLVDEGDVPGMARAMTSLAADPDRRLGMGRFNRNHIRRWDADGQIAKLADVLSAAALSERHRSRRAA